MLRRTVLQKLCQFQPKHLIQLTSLHSIEPTMYLITSSTMLNYDHLFFFRENNLNATDSHCSIVINLPKATYSQIELIEAHLLNENIVGLNSYSQLQLKTNMNHAKTITPKTRATIKKTTLNINAKNKGTKESSQNPFGVTPRKASTNRKRKIKLDSISKYLSKNLKMSGVDAAREKQLKEIEKQIQEESDEEKVDDVEEMSNVNERFRDEINDNIRIRFGEHLKEWGENSLKSFPSHGTGRNAMNAIIDKQNLVQYCKPSTSKGTSSMWKDQDQLQSTQIDENSYHDHQVYHDSRIESSGNNYLQSGSRRYSLYPSESREPENALAYPTNNEPKRIAQNDYNVQPLLPMHQKYNSDAHDFEDNEHDNYMRSSSLDTIKRQNTCDEVKDQSYYEYKIDQRKDNDSIRTTQNQENIESRPYQYDPDQYHTKNLQDADRYLQNYACEIFGTSGSSGRPDGRSNIPQGNEWQTPKPHWHSNYKNTNEWNQPQKKLIHHESHNQYHKYTSIQANNEQYAEAEDSSNKNKEMEDGCHDTRYQTYGQQKFAGRPVKSTYNTETIENLQNDDRIYERCETMERDSTHGGQSHDEGKTRNRKNCQRIRRSVPNEEMSIFGYNSKCEYTERGIEYSAGAYESNERESMYIDQRFQNRREQDIKSPEETPNEHISSDQNEGHNLSDGQIKENNVKTIGSQIDQDRLYNLKENRQETHSSKYDLISNLSMSSNDSGKLVIDFDSTTEGDFETGIVERNNRTDKNKSVHGVERDLEFFENDTLPLCRDSNDTVRRNLFEKDDNFRALEKEPEQEVSSNNNLKSNTPLNISKIEDSSPLTVSESCELRKFPINCDLNNTVKPIEVTRENCKNEYLDCKIDPNEKGGDCLESTRDNFEQNLSMNSCINLDQQHAKINIVDDEQKKYPVPINNPNEKSCDFKEYVHKSLEEDVEKLDPCKHIPPDLEVDVLVEPLNSNDRIVEDTPENNDVRENENSNHKDIQIDDKEQLDVEKLYPFKHIPQDLEVDVPVKPLNSNDKIVEDTPEKDDMRENENASHEDIQIDDEEQLTVLYQEQSITNGVESTEKGSALPNSTAEESFRSYLEYNHLNSISHVECEMEHEALGDVIYKTDKNENETEFTKINLKDETTADDKYNSLVSQDPNNNIDASIQNEVSRLPTINIEGHKDDNKILFNSLNKEENQYMDTSVSYLDEGNMETVKNIDQENSDSVISLNEKSNHEQDKVNTTISLNMPKSVEENNILPDRSKTIVSECSFENPYERKHISLHNAEAKNCEETKESDIFDPSQSIKRTVDSNQDDISRENQDIPEPVTSANIDEKMDPSIVSIVDSEKNIERFDQIDIGSIPKLQDGKNDRFKDIDVPCELDVDHAEENIMANKEEDQEMNCVKAESNGMRTHDTAPKSNLEQDDYQKIHNFATANFDPKSNEISDKSENIDENNNVNNTASKIQANQESNEHHEDVNEFTKIQDSNIHKSSLIQQLKWERKRKLKSTKLNQRAQLNQSSSGKIPENKNHLKLTIERIHKGKFVSPLFH